MALTFRDSIRAYVPRWLSDRPRLGFTVGFRLLYCVAALCDAGAQYAVEGVQLAWPGQGTPTALPAIGRGRGIRRGYSEPDTSYAARLVGWLDDWRTAGSAHALLRQLAGYFAPNPPRMRVVNNAGTRWFTLEPDGTFEIVRKDPSNWNWDGNATDWARFWIVIYCSGGAPFDTEGTWGSGGAVWGDGGTWGSTATPDQAASLLAIIEDWKSAHSVAAWIVLAFDPASFDPAAAPGAPMPDGTWGRRGHDDAGVYRPVRNRTARYGNAFQEPDDE